MGDSVKERRSSITAEIMKLSICYVQENMYYKPQECLENVISDLPDQFPGYISEHHNTFYRQQFQSDIYLVTMSESPERQFWQLKF